MGFEPHMLTPGRIASELGVPLPRITYILATRPHIRPAARAGTLRLYDRCVIPMIRHELSVMNARRQDGEAVANG